MLMALHGSGNDSEPLEIRFSSDDNLLAKAPCWDDLLLLTTDNVCSPKFRYYIKAVWVECMDTIVPIPPFMTVALMRANTSDSTVRVWPRLKPSSTSWKMKPTTKRISNACCVIWFTYRNGYFWSRPDYAVDRSIWISIDWHANPSPKYPENASWLKKHCRARQYAFMAEYRYQAQPQHEDSWSCCLCEILLKLTTLLVVIVMYTTCLTWVVVE